MLKIIRKKISMFMYIMLIVDIVYIYNKKNISGFGIIDKYIIMSYYCVDINDVKLYVL